MQLLGTKHQPSARTETSQCCRALRCYSRTEPWGQEWVRQEAVQSSPLWAKKSCQSTRGQVTGEGWQGQPSQPEG